MLNAVSVSRQLLPTLTNSVRTATAAMRPQISSRALAGQLRFPLNNHARNFMTQMPSTASMRKPPISSFTAAVRTSGPQATTQQRGIFTMVSQEDFAKMKDGYEFVGYHGTTRWAVESIEANGIDLGLTGKYRGGISGAGTGLYTTDKFEIAHHYARRAGVGESDAFDLDTRPQIIAVYRAITDKPESAKVPPEIQGKRDKVEAFRAENPTHEYDLGRTPAPPRLEKKGIVGSTLLITDRGLSDPQVKYVGVALPPGGAAAA